MEPTPIIHFGVLGVRQLGVDHFGRIDTKIYRKQEIR